MKKRVLILGTGKRCQKCWIKLILERDDLEIVAMADPSEVSRRDTLEQYPQLQEVPFLTDVESFLEAGIPADMAVVCTPPGTHFPQIMALMQNGMDVLTEKPVVLRLEDGKKALGRSEFPLQSILPVFAERGNQRKIRQTRDGHHFVSSRPGRDSGLAQQIPPDHGTAHAV